MTEQHHADEFLSASEVWFGKCPTYDGDMKGSFREPKTLNKDYVLGLRDIVEARKLEHY